MARKPKKANSGKASSRKERAPERSVKRLENGPPKNPANPLDNPEDGLWIAPRYSLKGPAGERAWENRPGGAPNSGKYLELADIALGLKKPDVAFKKRKASAHVTAKTEPYTS
ncbi:MAG TPA: hypothetical protein VGK22_01955 [Candidatus Angelobacter sp.]|jgi:hypothetical protein